jgi:DNA-binding FadR family transcriptional regulator
MVYYAKAWGLSSGLFAARQGWSRKAQQGMSKPGGTLSTRIAQDLLHRIIGAEFPPGSMLPSERELQESYQVSRPVVREALKLLAARGLVATATGQGAVVKTDLTRPAIDALLLAFHSAHVCAEDLLNTRLLLEPQIARLAAQHATPQQSRRLKSIAAALAQISFAGDEAGRTRAKESWGTLDAQFHVVLAESAQNPVLAILITVLVGILWRQRHASGNDLPDDWRALALEQHRLVAEAVAARDGERAQQLMVAHLESTRANLQALPEGLQALIAI